MEFSRLWGLVLSLAFLSAIQVEGSFKLKGIPKYVVRKCCKTDEYYNLDTQNCVKGGGAPVFDALVRARLVKGNVRDLSIVTGRMSKCPKTGECFETNEIVNDNSHTLLPNGVVFETFFGQTYDLRNYCLESVGRNSKNVSLAIAFCLPETNVLPKCCPENHYFDAKTYQCIRYPKNDRSENLLSTFFFFKNEMFLQYQHDLECSKAFPVRYNLLKNAYIDECGNICLNNRSQCYSIRKYCLDGAFTGRLEPSVYVCADNITKTCCKSEYYDENEIECTCGLTL